MAVTRIYKTTDDEAPDTLYTIELNGVIKKTDCTLHEVIDFLHLAEGDEDNG